VACGDDDGEGPGGGSVQTLCQRGCALEASLACPNDTPATCVAECEQAAADAPAACQTQASAAIECAANQPASDWECEADGTAGPREGVCSEPFTALLICLVGNGPDDGTCPFENDDECDDPTGTALCDAGTDLADCAGE
jgi:hypothetical protein